MPEDQLVSMYDENELKENEVGGVNLGRHQAQCTICLSPYREQIEQEWISWRATNRLAEEFGLTRYAIYRHAHALGLFKKRQRNIRMALERMIERVDHADVTSSGVVSAVKAYVKITSAEEGKENQQRADLKNLFERMSPVEREAFVCDGSLPGWFSNEIGATPIDGQDGGKES
jgi:hypothetical protein